MKQSVYKKIENLQRKFNFKRRGSLDQRLLKDKKLKTEPLSSSLLVINQKDEFEKGKDLQATDSVFTRQSSIKSPSSKHHQYKFTDIGKKYFNLQSYKAKFFSQQQFLHKSSFLPKVTKIESHNIILPKIKIPYYSEDQSDERVKKRALTKVSQIYQQEQQAVRQISDKINRIKHRIKLLDKINSDKKKLKEKYVQISYENH